MSISRRAFVKSSAAAIVAPGAATAALRAAGSTEAVPDSDRRVATGVRPAAAGPGFDPWLEIVPAAIRHNVEEIARAVGGRPILAVVKNNAYGLGLGTVCPALAALDAVWGCAVVQARAALEIRDAGFRKPIVVMGRVADDEIEALLARDVQLTPFHDGDGERLSRIARRVRRTVPIHFYLDTGMGRLGMSFRRALPWIEDLASRRELRIEGAFMTFTEVDDFDPVQLERLLGVARQARGRGVDLGRLHAASSHSLFHRPDAFLDMVRPGLVLYGAYPVGGREAGLMALRPAFRLKAGVVRVERLEAGDSVSYDRSYVAQRPVWVATLPVGHADGYPRRAVEGCEVLVEGRPYPVIGAVSASHSIVEVGEEKRFDVGAEATLIGPDHPAVHPNTIAERAGISVYDVLMHLSARLPKRVV